MEDNWLTERVCAAADATAAPVEHMSTAWSCSKCARAHDSPLGAPPRLRAGLRMSRLRNVVERHVADHERDMRSALVNAILASSPMTTSCAANATQNTCLCVSLSA